MQVKAIYLFQKLKCFLKIRKSVPISSVHSKVEVRSLWLENPDMNGVNEMLHINKLMEYFFLLRTTALVVPFQAEN